VSTADASTLDATSPTPPVDAGADSDANPDAGDPLQALAECQACLFEDCGPALVSCLGDETCRSIAQCALTSSCLPDLASCAAECILPLDLEPAEALQQLLLLQQLATSCTSCLATCQSAVPSGALPEAGIPGFP